MATPKRSPNTHLHFSITMSITHDISQHICPCKSYTSLDFYSNLHMHDLNFILKHGSSVNYLFVSYSFKFCSTCQWNSQYSVFTTTYTLNTLYPTPLDKAAFWSFGQVNLISHNHKVHDDFENEIHPTVSQLNFLLYILSPLFSNSSSELNRLVENTSNLHNSLSFSNLNLSAALSYCLFALVL